MAFRETACVCLASQDSGVRSCYAACDHVHEGPEPDDFYHDYVDRDEDWRGARLLFGFKRMAEVRSPHSRKDTRVTAPRDQTLTRLILQVDHWINSWPRDNHEALGVFLTVDDYGPRLFMDLMPYTSRRDQEWGRDAGKVRQLLEFMTDTAAATDAADPAPWGKPGVI